MQRGTIVKRRGSWALFYYEDQIREGKRKRVRVCKKLARISSEYPTRTSVRQLADDILAPLNRKQSLPESSRHITDFIEKVYFPTIEHELRPSTVESYKYAIYYPHLKDRLNKPPLRLKDFRSVHAQRILREIDGVGHTTLLHIKNFLSGIFRFARREGFLDTPNPLIDVTVPGRPMKYSGVAYTIEDAEAMVERIKDETTADVIVLLSLTGLRQSEARALRWSDWDEKEQTLTVGRSVWTNQLGPTKNLASENTIPVLPLLSDLLANRRERIKPNPHDYIFAGRRRGAPLDFHNLVNRIIKPALKGSPVEWKGFHGFRRGLGSNLLALGINPATIARILRHGSVSTTLEFYARARESESRDAMEQLEKTIRSRPSNVLVNGKQV